MPPVTVDELGRRWSQLNLGVSRPRRCDDGIVQIPCVLDHELSRVERIAWYGEGPGDRGRADVPADGQALDPASAPQAAGSDQKPCECRTCSTPLR